MAGQERKRKPTRKKDDRPQEQEQAEVDAAVDEEAEAIKAATDAMLDEIDGMLEENAEVFVRNYVQKGGE